MLGSIDFMNLTSLQLKSCDFDRIGNSLLVPSDGLYIVNLYRNVGKAGKLLNSADYESFACLNFLKM